MKNLGTNPECKNSRKKYEKKSLEKFREKFQKETRGAPLKESQNEDKASSSFHQEPSVKC